MFPRAKIQIVQIPIDAISSNNNTHDQLEYERNLHAENVPSHIKLSIAQIQKMLTEILKHKQNQCDKLFRPHTKLLILRIPVVMTQFHP